MLRSQRLGVGSTVLALWVSLFAPPSLGAQITARERQRAEQILGVVVADLRRYYWDTTFGGLDLDSLRARAKAEIAGATLNAQVNGAIAKVPLALNDSHTRFIPPMYAGRTALGWHAEVVGDSLYVTSVWPGSLADSAGLRVGDRVVAINQWPVQRSQWSPFQYLVEDLQPRDRLAVTIDRDQDTVETLIVPTQHRATRQYLDLSSLGSGSDWYELLREMQGSMYGFDSEFTPIGQNVLYWHLHSFAVSTRHIQDGLKELRGRETLILDLRGNSGGYVQTVLDLLGRFATPEMAGQTIARVRGRDQVTLQVVPRIAERERWHGQLIVLVDGASMSGAELAADVLQRLGRAKVLGDRTAGYLTVARAWSHMSSGATSVFYATSIAVGMLERPDGSRIEGVGVTPDELILPTREDIVGHRDPVLARAAQIAGLPYDPREAWNWAAFPEKFTVDR